MKHRDWERDPVDGKELSAFYKRVQALADKEFGVDDGGDSSVEVIPVDRTRCHRLQYHPVPYAFRKGNEELALDKAQFNLSVAHEAFEREWRGRNGGRNR